MWILKRKSVAEDALKREKKWVLDKKKTNKPKITT